MSDSNIVILTGNLTRKPELRYTPQGTGIADFGLASNRRYKVGDELQEETCFVEVTVFGSTAVAVASHLDKGRKVLVEGRLRFSQWESGTGAKRSKLEVVAERVNFLPQWNKNGTGTSVDAGDREAAIA